MKVLEKQLHALMLDSLSGDEASYRYLLEQVAMRLRIYFSRRLGSDHSADVEDLVQETLMAVHTRRATYDPDRPFTVWLHAMARYKLIDHYRYRNIRKTVPVDDVRELFIEDTAREVDARLDIERMMETLPPRQRDLIRDVKITGLSMTEASTRRGISETSAKVSIHRGLRALANRFGAKET